MDSRSSWAFVAAERELLAPLGLSVPQLWRGVERASARLCEPPLTLCHGDCHIGNTYQLRVKPPTHSADHACSAQGQTEEIPNSNSYVFSRKPFQACSAPLQAAGKPNVSSGPKRERVFGAQDNRLGLLDWQLTLRSSWARDVSYIMATVSRTNIFCLCCPDDLRRCIS